MRKHTKAQRIEYHIIKGEQKKYFQKEKKRQLLEIGFKVKNNGDVSFMGRPIYKPDYIWFRIGMEHWLSKKQKAVFLEWIAFKQSPLRSIAYRIFSIKKEFRIVWRKQINVYSDYHIKILIEWDKAENTPSMRVFVNAVEFISWFVKNNVDVENDYLDLFYNNPNILLPEVEAYH